jgi:hypothetical protein
MVLSGVDMPPPKPWFAARGSRSMEASVKSA